MENVSNEVLQAFALKQFLHLGAGRNLLASTEGPATFRTATEVPAMTPDEISAFFESYAWLRTGIEAGYFPAAEPYDESERKTLATIAREANPNWSPEFKDLINSFLTLDYFMIVQAERDDENIPARETFQAALLASRSFRDPLIAPLLNELRTPEASILDEDHKRADIAQVYESFDTPPATPTIESLLAGLFPLLDMLQTFTTLFPFDEQPAKFYGPEITINEAIGTLASCRLNLLDQRATDRFVRLRDLFFHTLERVRRLATPVTWSSTATLKSFNSLFGGWTLFSMGKGARILLHHEGILIPRMPGGVMTFDLNRIMKTAEVRKIY